MIETTMSWKCSLGRVAAAVAFDPLKLWSCGTFDVGCQTERELGLLAVTSPQFPIQRQLADYLDTRVPKV